MQGGFVAFRMCSAAQSCSTALIITSALLLTAALQPSSPRQLCVFGVLCCGRGVPCLLIRCERGCLGLQWWREVAWGAEGVLCLYVMPAAKANCLFKVMPDSCSGCTKQATPVGIVILTACAGQKAE
jgi:hypothetical protein